MLGCITETLPACSLWDRHASCTSVDRHVGKLSRIHPRGCILSWASVVGVQLGGKGVQQMLLATNKQGFNAAYFAIIGNQAASLRQLLKAAATVSAMHAMMAHRLPCGLNLVALAQKRIAQWGEADGPDDPIWDVLKHTPQLDLALCNVCDVQGGSIFLTCVQVRAGPCLTHWHCSKRTTYSIRCVAAYCRLILKLPWPRRTQCSV